MSWFDYFVRLLPAVAVIGGLIGARMQLAENRRQNSIAIAKNYYREMLELFQNNTDILYAGINEEEAMSRLERGSSELSSLQTAFYQHDFRVAGGLFGVRYRS